LSLDWGTAMLAGLVLGSWASARSQGPVVWRPADAPQLARRLLGGLAMGVGATVAGGCNIGNALTGLAALSAHSMVATIGMGVGGYLAVRLLEPLGAGAPAGQVRP
jgi:uncharacterized membrane protein YedE/YeeE